MRRDPLSNRNSNQSGSKLNARRRVYRALQSAVRASIGSLGGLLDLLMPRMVLAIPGGQTFNFKSGKRRRPAAPVQCVVERFEPKLLMSSITWANASGHGNWSDTAAWTGGVVPTSVDTAVFPSATTIVTPNLTAGASVAGITVDNSGSDYSITQTGNQTLTLGSGGISVSGATTSRVATTTISPNIAMAANQTWTTTISNGKMNLVVNGAISGAFGLTKAGTGNLLMVGAGSYTGTTTISAGTLQVGNAGTSGTLGTGNVADNSNLLFYRSDSVTIAQAITGTGAVLKNGAGALILSGANTYSGGTTDSAGTLVINNASAIGTGTLTMSGGNLDNTSGGAITLANNPEAWNSNFTFAGTNSLSLGTGTVTLSGARQVTISANSLTVGGVITGSFSVTKAGSGSLIFAGANTYTGGTTVSAGTLAVNNANAVGSGTLTMSGGNLDNTSGSAITLANNPQTWNGNFTFTGTNSLNLGTGAVKLGSNRQVTVSANSLTVGGVISGSYAVTKAGSGRLIFTGANTYSGITTISDGVLQIGNGGTTGTLGTGSITGDGVLAFDRSDVVTDSKALSGTAGLTQMGAGTLILTAGNTYTGVTTITAGRLQVGNGGTAGMLPSGDIYNDSVLAFDRSNALAVPSAISGAGCVYQLAGTITLDGSNTYSGGTVISGGILKVGDDLGGYDSSLGSGSVVNNAALVFNNNNNYGSSDSTVANDISGTGSVTLSGEGTTIFTGNDTYSGATTITANFVVNATLNSSCTVSSGGSLSGTGTIGAVTVSNSITPGSGSTGIMTIGNLTLNLHSNFYVQIDGNGAGTGYNQTAITGNVSLNTAYLNLSGTRTNHDGDQIVIINNTGGNAVSGTFYNLAEGATVNVNGVNYVITYHGGSGGNSVVLTDYSPPQTVPDDYTTIENQTLVGSDITGTSTPSNANDNGVLANDTTLGDALSVYSVAVTAGGVTTTTPLGGNTVIVDTAKHGTLTISPNGSFTYAPPQDYVGLDGTTTDTANVYVATDGVLQSTPTPVQFFINDASLTPSTYNDLAPTEGESTGDTVVASFTDGSGNTDPSEYTATTDWGDGNVTGGAITWNSTVNAFNVTDSHTYAEDGSYSVSTTITDTGGGATTTATGTATVADASLTATSVTAHFATGFASTGYVAHFTDPGNDGTTSDYSGTITWGDGNSSDASFTSDGSGGFYVSGTNTYATAGTYTTSVTINDAGGSSATVTGSATAGPRLTHTALHSLSPTEMADTGDVLLTTFVDHTGATDPTGYTASIDWGDGSTSDGTIDWNSTTNSFTVTGDHTFAEEGEYYIGVTITTNDDSASTFVSGGRYANDAALSATPINITTAVEGTAFTGNVADFTDPGNDGTPYDYYGTITWGDGNSSDASFTPDGSGGFYVSGTNTYAEDGSYATSVAIYDVGGSSATVSGSATVADAAPTVATAASASPAPVTGTSTTLSVLGADDDGEPYLTYGWSLLGTPPGTVAYSANGTNAAKSTVATFSTAGVYDFLVTITNPNSLTVTSEVDMTVVQSPSSLSISPSTKTLRVGDTQSFSATVSSTDQFGNSLSLSGSDYAWSLESSPNGTLSSLSGSSTTYTAGTIGSDTLTLSVRGVTATAAITAIADPHSTFSGPSSVTAGVPYVLHLTADSSVIWTIPWGDGTTGVYTGNPDYATHVFEQSSSTAPAISPITSDAAGDYDAASVSPTFGSSGTVTVASGGSVAGASLALAAGGNIVIGETNGASQFTLLELNGDGTTNTSFGTGGSTSISVSAVGSTIATAVQPDGKIVLAGTSGSGTDLTLARFNINGSVDTYFGTSGTGLVTVAAPAASVDSISIDLNGIINLSGQASTGSPGYVAEFNGDGSLDTDFGSGGIAPTATDMPHPMDSVRTPGGTVLQVVSTVISCTSGWQVVSAPSTPPEKIPPYTTDCHCPGCCSDPASTPPPPGTPRPIGYASGMPEFTNTDLASSGFTGGWSIMRNWTTDPDYLPDTTFGYGWMNNRQTFVRNVGGDPTNPNLLVVNTAYAQFGFNYDSSTAAYVPAAVSNDSLVHDTGAATYSWLDAQSGATSTYYDFSSTNAVNLQGKLKATVDAAGNTINFTYNSSGQLTTVTQTDAAGDTEYFTYNYFTSGNNAGQISSIQQSLQRVGESTPTVFRQAVYTYYQGNYTGDDAFGNQGDLKTVSIEDGSGNVINESYYRYYTPDDVDNGQPGTVGALKFVVTPESFSKLSAAVSNPFTATDAQLAPFADNYFQYDADGRAVSENAAAAGASGDSGQGVSPLSYYTNPDFPTSGTPDFNTWRQRTIEMLSDGNQNIVYTNVNQDVLLEIQVDNVDPANSSNFSNAWITGYQYDSSGRLIASISTSAIDSSFYTLSDPSAYEAYADLGLTEGGVLSSSGLINTTSYYSTTTATSSTPGGAAGYTEADYVQQGSSGTPIEQDFYTYFSHTDANGNTIYPAATSTVYRNTDGTGAETTSYAYTYYTGTNERYFVTASAPVVSGGQNGPDAADVTTDIYDTYGRVIWSADPKGFLTYNQYDTATGALIKTIQDVDTTLTSEFDPSTLPFDWTTPSGGGLNLITTYQVDDQGRTTKETSPNGNVTYTAYDDANHAAFSFPGATETLDGSGNGTLATTGPITMVRSEIPYTYTSGSSTIAGTYDETMTFSGTVSVNDYQIVLPGFIEGNSATSGPSNVLNLIGNGSTGSPQYTIQTLSRTLNNTAGQVVESDSYASIDNATYLATVPNNPYSGSLVDPSTGSGNYYASYQGYDLDGRAYKSVDANGTITDTVFDGRGRVVATWVGTNDAIGSGTSFDGTNAGTGNNMTEVSSDVYDGGGVGDSNVTQATQYVDGTNSDNRVSQMLYDWRDRLVATKSGAASTLGAETDGIGRPITVNTLDNLGETTASFVFDGDGIALSDFASGVSTTTSGGNTVAIVDPEYLRSYSTTAYDDQGRTYQSQTYLVDQTTGTIGSSPLTASAYYDQRGNLMATVDPRGIWTKYAYDGAARQVAQYTTDGAGGTTWTDASTVAGDVVWAQQENQYDADSNVIETIGRIRLNADSGSDTGALGDLITGPNARVSYAASYFDAANRDIADVNVGTNGGTTWTRPSSVPSRSDAVLVTSTAYNAAGWAATVTDPRGIQSEALYDNLGRAIETIAAWDGTSSPTPTDSTNQTTLYTYDAASHVTSKTLLLAGSGLEQTRYIYGVSPSQGSAITTNDLLALVEYPDPTSGAASTSTSGQNSFTYNAQGETVTTTAQTGTIQTTSYNVLGQVVQQAISTPDSSGSPSTSYAYDTLGDLTGTTDPSGNTTNYQYDSLGRKTETIQPSPDGVAARPTTAYSYDADGNLTAVTDANGNTTTYAYDLLNRQTQMTSPDPDGSGTLTASVTTYFYNTGSDGSGTQVTDPLGNVSGATPALHTTTTVVDDFGRTSEVIQSSPDGVAAQPTTTYTYDRDGNELSITDPVSNTTSYTYDNLNRQITATNASGTQTSVYDAAGNLISSTDRDGRTTTYTYNARNQLTAENWLDSSSAVIYTISYSYDATGRLTSTSDSNSATTYTYDDLNRVTSETLTLAALASQTIVLDRSYDASNRQTLLAASVGGVDDLLNHYSYDNLNRLTSVQQADMADAVTAGWIASPGTYTANMLSAKRADFGYNTLGQATSISRYSNLSATDSVASTAYGYDDMNRLTGITHTVNTTGTPTTISYAFAYDANSQITQMVNADGTSNYAYDNNGQLLSDSLSAESYSFDANGNRTSANGTTYGTPGADNQVSNDGTYTYTYDANGNRLTRTSTATGQVDNYTWDYRNRLTEVVTKTSSGTTVQTVSYTYDTFNRRIGMTVKDGSGTVTLAENYVYDGTNLLLVLDASGNVTQRFFNGPSGVLAQENVSGGTSTTSWALTDQVGSIRDVVDNGTGHAVLDHIIYDSFGNIVSQTHLANALRMGYTGMVTDAETGLYYDHARYYDSATGGFISQDPTGFAARDANLYRYTMNDPVNFVDRNGRQIAPVEVPPEEPKDDNDVDDDPNRDPNEPVPIPSGTISAPGGEEPPPEYEIPEPPAPPPPTNTGVKPPPLDDVPLQPPPMPFKPSDNIGRDWFPPPEPPTPPTQGAEPGVPEPTGSGQQPPKLPEEPVSPGSEGGTGGISQRTPIPEKPAGSGDAGNAGSDGKDGTPGGTACFPAGTLVYVVNSSALRANTASSGMRNHIDAHRLLFVILAGGFLATGVLFQVPRKRRRSTAQGNDQDLPEPRRVFVRVRRSEGGMFLMEVQS
jgi:RHS repeat-associated protein